MVADAEGTTNGCEERRNVSSSRRIVLDVHVVIQNAHKQVFNAF